MSKWRVRLTVALGILGLLVGFGLGGPSPWFKPRQHALAPFASHSVEVAFEPEQLTRAICIGDGSSFLGLYVFDPHGNCVAWEDVNDLEVRDDLAVEFYPADSGPYRVEVINLGKNYNRFKLALK